jgi:hypothetical protein
MIDRGRVRAFEARHSYDPVVRTVLRQWFEEPDEFPRTPLPNRSELVWAYDVERRLSGQAFDPSILEAVVRELKRMGDRDVVTLCSDSAEIEVHRVCRRAVSVS